VTKGVRKAGKTLKDAERRRLGRRSRAARDASGPAGVKRLPEGWAVLRCDGGSRGNPGPAAYAFVLEAGDGTVLASGSAAIGVATAGTAEYRAVAEGLEAALAVEVAGVEVRTDSRLVVRHLTDPGRALRNPGLRELRDRSLATAAQVGGVAYRWVPASENGAADARVGALLV
jgi:ribonuclease HI